MTRKVQCSSYKSAKRNVDNIHSLKSHFNFTLPVTCRESKGIYLSICLQVYLSPNLFVISFVCLSPYISACLPIYPPNRVYSYVYRTVYLCVCHYICQFTYLSVCSFLSICLSYYLPICLRIFLLFVFTYLLSYLQLSYFFKQSRGLG